MLDKWRKDAECPSVWQPLHIIEMMVIYQMECGMVAAACLPIIIWVEFLVLIAFQQSITTIVFLFGNKL